MLRQQLGKEVDTAALGNVIICPCFFTVLFTSALNGAGT
jgi:hypothetical protein